MTFKLEIDCDNTAFGDDDWAADREVARILRVLVDKLETGKADYSGTALRDINGNTVGKAWIES